SSCLLALGASVVLTSQRGERVLGLPDFLLDYYATALEPDEVLTAITVPPPVDGQAGLYLRHLRTAAEHRPLCNLALSVRNEDGICRAASLVVGASTPVPARLPKTEALMLGNAMTPELARVVSDSAAGEMSALDDSRASESFRRQVAAVMARRAISSLFGVTLDQGEM
ncbi:MAG: FAD binding domain-containing protein, partial [Pigmentiphaga sp.]|nr:FAD binding domain-containing protein [Pigmentiphaga sp.]